MAQITVVKTGTLELRIPDLPLFIPAEAKAVVDSLTRDALQAALSYVAGQVAERAPRNFGALAQSFQASPAGTTGGIEILGVSPQSQLVGRVFSSLPYAIVMEEGRRPGFPVSRAGIASIALWVRRKLGLSGGEAKSATYAIATVIRQRGLPARHFAREGFKAAAPQVERIFQELAGGLAEGLAGGRRGGAA